MTKPLYLPTSMVLFGEGLPRQCGRHGEPTDTTRKVTFLSRPPLWARALLLAGVLPGVLACLLGRRRLVAPAWPVCHRCTRRRRMLLAGAALTGAVTAVVVAGALAVDPVALAPVAAGAGAAGGVALLVLASLRSWRSVASAHLSADRQHLVLRRPGNGYSPTQPYPEDEIPWAPVMHRDVTARPVGRPGTVDLSGTDDGTGTTEAASGREALPRRRPAEPAVVLAGGD